MLEGGEGFLDGVGAPVPGRALAAMGRGEAQTEVTGARSDIEARKQGEDQAKEIAEVSS